MFIFHKHLHSLLPHPQLLLMYTIDALYILSKIFIISTLRQPTVDAKSITTMKCIGTASWLNHLWCGIADHWWCQDVRVECDSELWLTWNYQCWQKILWLLVSVSPCNERAFFVRVCACVCVFNCTVLRNILSHPSSLYIFGGNGKLMQQFIETCAITHGNTAQKAKTEFVQI